MDPSTVMAFILGLGNIWLTIWLWKKRGVERQLEETQQKLSQEVADHKKTKVALLEEMSEHKDTEDALKREKKARGKSEEKLAQANACLKTAKHWQDLASDYCKKD